LDRQPD
jgi:hypothetical protein